MNSQKQINDNFATRNITKNTTEAALADTILHQAFIPYTPTKSEANRKAYGLGHDTPTLRMHAADMKLACKIAIADPFQNASCDALDTWNIASELVGTDVIFDLAVDFLTAQIQHHERSHDPIEYETAWLDLLPRKSQPQTASHTRRVCIPSRLVSRPLTYCGCAL